jgi:hypothetical protein
VKCRRCADLETIRFSCELIDYLVAVAGDGRVESLSNVNPFPSGLWWELPFFCGEATSGSLSRSFYLFLHDSIAAVHV